MTLPPLLHHVAAGPLSRRLLLLGLAVTLVAIASSLTFPPGPPSFSSGLVLNLGHLPLYGLLAATLLGLSGRPPRPWPALLWLPLLVLAIGVLDEWHQATVPERSSSLLDLGTDLLAVLLVLGVAAWERGPRRPSALAHLLGLGLALALYWDALILLAGPRPLPWVPSPS